MPPPLLAAGTLRDHELIELQRQAEESNEVFRLPDHLKEKVGGMGWSGVGCISAEPNRRGVGELLADEVLAWKEGVETGLS